MLPSSEYVELETVAFPLPCALSGQTSLGLTAYELSQDAGRLRGQLNQGLSAPSVSVGIMNSHHKYSFLAQAPPLELRQGELPLLL